MSSPHVYAYNGFGVYPVQYLAVIIVLNLFIAYSSYEDDREIGYLLLSSNLFVCSLIFILEIFYLTHPI